MTDVHTPAPEPEPAADGTKPRVSFGINGTERGRRRHAADRGRRRPAPAGCAGGGGSSPPCGPRWSCCSCSRSARCPGRCCRSRGPTPARCSSTSPRTPALAPWLNHLGLFNVFAAPWFAAIYLLLFASLVGCVVPRTFRLVGSARTPPPRAPRNLGRLPHSASYPSALAPEAAVDAAAAMLGGQRFRLRRPAAGDSGHWVSAEKGYLREVGNLLFHLSLLGVLLSIAVGGLFGYKADKLLVEGQAFADTTLRARRVPPGAAGHRVRPGAVLADAEQVHRRATSTSGESRGQPSDFDADVTYAASPGAAAGDVPHQDQRPAVGRLAEGVPDRARVRAGVQGDRTPTGRWPTTRRRRSSRLTPGTFLSDGVVKALGRLARLHGRVRADRDLGRRDARVDLPRAPTLPPCR